MMSVFYLQGCVVVSIIYTLISLILLILQILLQIVKKKCSYQWWEFFFINNEF